MTPSDRQGDRRLLGAIALISSTILAGVVLGTFLVNGEMSKEAWGLLGVIVGGLISQPQAVIAAVKEGWLGRTIDRQGDKLHASKPDPEMAGLRSMESEDLPQPTFGSQTEGD